jgi:hypothetical protein
MNRAKARWMMARASRWRRPLRLGTSRKAGNTTKVSNKAPSLNKENAKAVINKRQQ